VSTTALFHDLVSGRRRGVGATLARLGLTAASVPYGAGARLKNLLFAAGLTKSHHAGAPVVSVGNLTLGGTGKTPCVEYLARYYRDLDRRVTILSRGYGSGDGPNDEALVLEENLSDVPHLQGADRVALAGIAVEELEADLLVLDDGFQHRRLARDLDVVLIDASVPPEMYRMFPRGVLREPISSLRRADAVMLTRCDQMDVRFDQVRRRLLKHADSKPVVETTHAPVAWMQHGNPDRPVGSLRGRPVAAFCGIGNPDAFRRTLEDVNVEPVAFRTFPDHHAYTRTDVDDLKSWARQQPADTVLATTQKDLVKLRIDRLGERDLLALRIGLNVRAGPDADEFHRRLAAVG
jgi:tetraacyldisaccharide 4'-kinase